MKNNYTLFTTTTCPLCPEATEWAGKNLVVFDIVVADLNPKNMQLARDLGISSVPVFVDMDTLEKFTLEEMKQK